MGRTSVPVVVANAFAIWYFFFRRALYATTLWVFENGILSQRAQEINKSLWTEVENFRVGNEAGRQFALLTLRDGQRSAISLRDNPAVMPLLEYIEIKLSAAQFLPTLRRIFDGERVGFGIVKLDREGFTSPGYFLAVA